MYVTCCQIQNKYVLNLVKIFISKKKKKNDKNENKNKCFLSKYTFYK